MKTSIKIILGGLFLMLTTFPMFGQPGGRDMPSPEERAKRQTAHMTEELKLTSEQEKEVGDINLTYANKMKDARDEAAGDRTAMRAKMEAMMKEKSEALKEVLTEEQIKSFEEMESQNGQGRQGNKKKGKRGKGKSDKSDN